jgi:predicted small integral membrane protein
MSIEVVRTAKIVLVGCVGVLGILTGVDNILDYRTNFEVVRHVLSMDALPPGSPLAWRSITNPRLYRIAYAAIIAAELLYGSLCIFGALRLFGARGPAVRWFDAAKGPAVAGLALGFALYFFGFLAIGGEWFQMWQAGQWNMQQPAFRFLASIGFVLILLCLPDGDR